jgi:prolyl oligopeptidase
MNTALHRHGVAVVVAGTLAGVFSASSAAVNAPPVAPVKPVTDTYFGTPVTDNYRYLEDLANPEVQSWMHAQADYTRATLDTLPGRAALLDRIHELSNSDPRRGGVERRGQRYFYLFIEPGVQQPKLYYRDGLKGAEHLLLDPAELGKGTKTHFALDFYTPSWDGKYMAYGISAGGSENSVLHVMEVATGKVLAEDIDRTSNAVVAWRPDNHSFFYLRYSKPGPNTPASETLYNARTYLHTVGANVNGDADAAVFGRGVAKGLDVPEGQGTYVLLAPNSAYAIAVANHNMDSNPATLYVAPLAKVKDSGTPWRKVADVADGIVQYEQHGDMLYFVSQKNAPRFRILATPLAHPDVNHAKVIVPESKSVITGFEFAKEGMYVRERDGAVSHLVLVSPDGKESHAVPLPFEGNLGGPTTDPLENGALFNMQGWVQAPRIFSYDPATGKVEDTGFNPPSKIDTSQLESKEVQAVGSDGTLIPLSIVYKKGIALDGSHPTILRGYGSYGLSMEAGFNAVAIAWIERGGVWAVAHIRGGGENGEEWHLGGKMRTKANTYLDFISCGQYLVDNHYTSPKLMAANGGSAGGITVGRAFTVRPDLFSVIIDQVGMSDTLRFETEPNGPPNTLEFGSTKNEDGFHSLYGMSTYAHVRDGVPYPAIIFATGANDPRVAPWHMAKMTARVQAATSSHHPVLLRIDYDAGHGMGSNRSQREVETADLWSFALWQMGDPAFQPAVK